MKSSTLPNNSEKIITKGFRKTSTEILKNKIDVSRILENRDFIRNDNNQLNGFDDEKTFDDFYDIDNDEVIKIFYITIIKIFKLNYLTCYKYSALNKLILFFCPILIIIFL